MTAYLWKGVCLITIGIIILAIVIELLIATIMARGTVDNQLRYGLLQAEQETITETLTQRIT
jgi:hypothetical protein